MQITKEDLQGIINNDEYPCPVVVVDYDPRPFGLSGAIAAYLPMIRTIWIFTVNLNALIAYHEARGETVTEERLMKGLRKLMRHELRHQQQHQWLIDKYGSVEYGTNMFIFVQRSIQYEFNPLELDAYRCQKGFEDDINTAMHDVFKKSLLAA